MMKKLVEKYGCIQWVRREGDMAAIIRGHNRHYVRLNMLLQAVICRRSGIILASFGA